MIDQELKTDEGFEEILAGRLVRNLRDEDDVEKEDEPVEKPVKSIEGKTEALQLVADEDDRSSLPSAEFVKVEKSLIALGYFTPSSRRIKNQKIKATKFTRTVDGKKVEVSAEFHPSPIFGLPVTADQDKFLALHHIITNLLKENGQISNPIRFTSAELLRLLKTDRGGKQYKDISEWLDVMTSTTIISDGVVWEAGKKRFARDRFHVFSRAVSVGKELPDGSISDANYVWLSEWQLENINHKHVLPIDLFVYRELKNHIAKALVPLLQVWLYASQKAGSFEKKYSELCEVLSLQVFKAPSRITQQLKGSLDELVQYGYLEKWRIERTADRRQFKILFFHGPKFHRDRNHRLQEKMQAEDVLVVAESEPVEPILPEPGRLDAEPVSGSAMPPARARAPRARKTSVDMKVSETVGKSDNANIQNLESSDDPSESTESKLIDELSARGLMPSSALKLLRAVPTERLENVFDYIDYWDETKKTKDVGPGFLNNLIKDGAPLPSNFETRRKREERLAAQQRERHLVRLDREIKASYTDHCTRMVDRFIAEEVPSEELERRVAERKRELIQQGGFWDGPNRDEITAKMALREVRAELSAGVKVSYEDFYRRQLPSTLVKLGLDPVELGLKPEKEGSIT